jgi:hypothetical protein
MSRLIRDLRRFTPDSSGIEHSRRTRKTERQPCEQGNSVQTRVLYLRGEHETGSLEDYVKGLRGSGFVQSRRPTDPGGHYAPDEQPNEVVAILRDFITS